MNKKVLKVLTFFIFNKELRKTIREKNRKIEFEKELDFMETEKARKKLKKIADNYPKVLSTSETLKEIIINKKSICRYGDGEFNLCSKKLKNPNIFQEDNLILKRRLKEILLSTDENILICIPPVENKYYEDPSIKSTKNDPKFWRRYWYKYGETIIKILKKDTLYGNALISRITGFLENELEIYKKIWDKRKVVFVYGKTGRFGRDQRVFDNILSFEEILIPAINAFDEYDVILDKCLKKDKENLFLIAAGATATVLAYDLAKNGYQALDIGHLPNSYQEFLGEILSPESLSKDKGENNKNIIMKEQSSK